MTNYKTNIMRIFNVTLSQILIGRQVQKGQLTFSKNVFYLGNYIEIGNFFFKALTFNMQTMYLNYSLDVNK